MVAECELKKQSSFFSQPSVYSRQSLLSENAWKIQDSDFFDTYRDHLDHLASHRQKKHIRQA